MKGVSIIICCYNSASRLPETIKHIALQEVNTDIHWELIIVNNNSSDNTKVIAHSEWKKYNLQTSFFIIDQPVPGLSNARKKGVENAKFEYIIFCDDDNWLDKNYINVAYDLMEQYTEIGAAGGMSTAVSDSNFPDWFNEVQNSYAVGKQSKTSGPITQRGYLWGAGIVIRKNLLDIVYNLDIETQLIGRNGSNLSAGDDSEICKWIILLRKELYYDESLIFKHFIAKERLTCAYKEKLFKGFDQTSTILKQYDLAITIAKQNRNKILNLLIGIKHIVFLNKNVSRTYIQFLIGPILRVSSKNDYTFIKNLYSLIYK